MHNRNHADTHLNNLTYTVKNGDTLISIANTFKTTVYHLIKINDIYSNPLIYPGQVLKVISNSYTKTYTIKKGDTLISIANKFNTTSYHLAKLNNIFDPTLIYPGQILKL